MKSNDASVTVSVFKATIAAEAVAHGEAVAMLKGLGVEGAKNMRKKAKLDGAQSMAFLRLAREVFGPSFSLRKRKAGVKKGKRVKGGKVTVTKDSDVLSVYESLVELLGSKTCHRLAKLLLKA